MSFTISLIGRPNVGKSTLFNRLTGKKHAITYDIAGVTRDRREAIGNIGPLSFKVIDTAGLEEGEEGSLQSKMITQTEFAIENSDLVLLLLDARSGICVEDEYFVTWIRKKNKPVLIVINKSEAKGIATNSLAQAYRFGFGEPICISAEHGEGMIDLYDAIYPIQTKYLADYKSIDIDDKDNEQHIQIAIMGRPNAGKSTLLNKLLKDDRVLTGPEPGITRDSVSINWKYNDKSIRLIDTAGLRRKSQIDKHLEKLAVTDTIRALKYAHVAILMIDASIGLESQDITIANMVLDEGRGLIIAVNKWDKIDDKDAFVAELKYQLNKQLRQIKGLAIIYLSALYGNNVYKTIDAALDSYLSWNIRINTSKLNMWLRDALTKHQLPLSSMGKSIKIKYITQIKTRPPSFVLFASHPKEIQDSYIKYLSNSLRDEFKLMYTPIRLSFKAGENPYKNKK